MFGKRARMLTRELQATVTLGQARAYRWQRQRCLNDTLSLRRAQAVAGVLAQHSGHEAKIEGLGKREPIVPKTRADGRDHPENRQRNRRAQILIGLPAS